MLGRLGSSKPRTTEASGHVVHDRTRSLHVVAIVLEHRHGRARSDTARYQLMRTRQQHFLLEGDALVVEGPSRLLGEVRKVERVEPQHVVQGYPGTKLLAVRREPGLAGKPGPCA